MLAVLERIDGTKRTVKHVTSEGLINRGKQRLAEGDEMGAIDFVAGGALGRDALGDSRPWGLWDERLGIHGGDLEQSIREALSQV